MATLTVDVLLGQVRWRLWRAQFVAAIRQASWATIAIMALATVVHWTWRSVRLDAVVAAIAAAWILALARAAWQRPSDVACAWWADRTLGGESAYSTLLDMRDPGRSAGAGAALRRLEAWTAARLPVSLAMLAQRRPDAGARNALLPALAACVVGALALTASPPPSPDGQARTPAGGVAQTAATDPSAPLPDVIADVARAQRPAAPDARSRPGGDGRTSVAPPRGATDGAQASRGVASDQGREVSSRAWASGESIAPAASASAARASAGGGAGREAGETPDERADRGVTPAAQPEPKMRTRESLLPRPSNARADPGEAGFFADDAAGAPASPMPALRAPAAVAPVSDGDDPALGPGRAAYVQSWMKATAPAR
jgi:hypothetical protein